MAHVHRTTMTPTKLELLAAWLPKQDWYAGGGGTPDLVKAGGFRLDDPAGEVGIEFMVVADAAGDADGEPVAYLVPMGYRGAPLEGASGEALIGTAEHGVLGTRWIYDGAHDPTVMAELRALLRGEAVPQDQNASDLPDPTVTVSGPGTADAAEATEGADGAEGADVRLNRVLRPGTVPVTADGEACSVVAGWTWPDGTRARGVVASVART